MNLREIMDSDSPDFNMENILTDLDEYEAKQCHTEIITFCDANPIRLSPEER